MLHVIGQHEQCLSRAFLSSQMCSISLQNMLAALSFREQPDPHLDKAKGDVETRESH